ncbi:MAG: hypothetical protein H6604_03695 [Flavobacteriales bacterium]|nr:hypothetical protein [Flavobacteriales bacterium]
MKYFKFLFFAMFLLNCGTQNSNDVFAQRWLDDYAVCECITQGLNKRDINDGSIWYWTEANPFKFKDMKFFTSFISNYVSKNSYGWGDKPTILNHCIVLKYDRRYVEIRDSLLIETQKDKTKFNEWLKSRKNETLNSF